MTVTVIDRTAHVAAILHAEAARRNEKAADAAAERMRDTVAIETGETRDSIESDGGEVSAGGAAVFLEYGTRNMAAQPFFQQAVDDAADEFGGLIF